MSSEFTDPNNLGQSTSTVGGGGEDSNIRDHIDGINSFLNSEIMPSRQGNGGAQ